MVIRLFRARSASVLPEAIGSASLLPSADRRPGVLSLGAMSCETARARSTNRRSTRTEHRWWARRRLALRPLSRPDCGPAPLRFSQLPAATAPQAVCHQPETGAHGAATGRCGRRLPRSSRVLPGEPWPGSRLRSRAAARIQAAAAGFCGADLDLTKEGASAVLVSSSSTRKAAI